MSGRMCSFRFRLERNTIPGPALCCCWIAGSSLGLVAACFCGDAFASYLVCQPDQIPGLSSALLLSVLPLLLSACAVVLFHPAVCYGFCLLRALGQGMLIAILGRTYGSGTPLLVFLLLFSPLCVNPLLLWYWHRCIREEWRSLVADTAVCGLFCMIIGVLDRLTIAPFLADVINS